MDLSVGQIITGKITGIKDYGLFVMFNKTQRAFIHITEISKDFISDIHSQFQIEQVVNFKVLVIKPEINSVNGSMKEVPQDNIETPIETKVESKPVRTKPEQKRRIYQPKEPVKPENFNDMVSQYLKQSTEQLRDISKRNKRRYGR